jgi:hypothetical protein
MYYVIGCSFGGVWHVFGEFDTQSEAEEWAANNMSEGFYKIGRRTALDRVPDLCAI